MPYRYSPPISMYVNPRRVEAATLLTKRYEENFAADSMLSQQLSQMQISPLPNDRKIAVELRKQFEQSLEERASRGDYHNMSRQVLLDANQFVKAYQPLKRNHDAYEGYRQGLDEQVEKGKITRDIANNSVAMSLYNNKGLTLDASGQVDQNSFFSGYKPAEYVNIREEQFKIADKMVAEKYQGAATIKQSTINGQLYDVIVEGQIVESISAQRIQQAMAPLKNDPKVAAYLNQEALFKTYNLDDEAIGAMLQEYAGNLRTQGSTQSTAELKAMFNLQAEEVEKAIADNPREMARLLITNQLFDQASQSTINAFAFQSVYGGGVKSANVNKVWFHGWKERQKELSAEGFNVSTTLIERQTLTPSVLEGAMADASTQIADQINNLKTIATYDGPLTANQILAEGDLPKEIQDYFDQHPDVKHATMQSIRSAQNRLTQLQKAKANATQVAQQTNQQLFETIRDRFRKATDNSLNDLTYEEFANAVEAYKYYQQNYLGGTKWLAKATSAGVVVSPAFSKDENSIFKELESTYGTRGLNILQNIEEFTNSAEIVSASYAEALAANQLPSQAVRATPNFVGSKAVNKTLSGTMPSNFVFSSAYTIEDSQITGVDLANAGAVIGNVMLLTQPVNGQLGYMVTLDRADKSTPIDPDFLEEIGGSSLLLLGDQIQTAGLEAVANEPMNILLTDLDALVEAGRTSGTIPLAGGYSIDVTNFQPSNMYGANVRVRETASGKAVYPVIDQATGQITEYLPVEPGDSRYNLTQMPITSPLFESIINLRNNKGLPVLFYGK